MSAIFFQLERNNTKRRARRAYFYDNTCWIMSALIEIVDGGFPTVRRSLFCFCFVTGRAERDLYFRDGKWTTPLALRTPGTHFFADFLQPGKGRQHWKFKLTKKNNIQFLFLNWVVTDWVLPVKEELKSPVDTFLAPSRNEKATDDGHIKKSSGRNVVQNGRPPVRILRIDRVILEPRLLRHVQQSGRPGVAAADK